MPRPTEMAGKAAGKMKAAKQVLAGHAGIMRKLAEEHGEVSILLKRCSQADDPAKRQELFTKIREELLSHAKAEEKVFYSRLKKHVESLELTEHAIEEHREIEEMIERLSTMGYEGDDWAELFDELEQSVVEHVKEEEQELFAKADDVLSKDELESMEQTYIAARAAEKQRLH